MSRASIRHAMYPFAIEAASVLAWAFLLGGLWLLGRGLSQIPLAMTDAVAGVTTAAGFLLGPFLIGAGLGWAFDDPDYGTAVGKLALLRSGGLVLPRVAAVSLLVWFVVGLLIASVLVATLLALLAFFLSVAGGLVGRRLRA